MSTTKKYLVTIMVETDDKDVTQEQIHEGLALLFHETVDDGDWNKGKFAVTHVFDGINELPE